MLARLRGRTEQHDSRHSAQGVRLPRRTIPGHEDHYAFFATAPGSCKNHPHVSALSPFFFPDGAKWSSLTEVRLNDANGKSAGNIDVVLVAYDDNDQIYDFGALEIQAVYISGNVRDPFEHYMKNPKARATMDWSTQPNYPRPDYLSSSRKRLAPQLLFKGGIIHSWRKKTAVALNKKFFDTLPRLTKVSKSKADIAWFIYDLKLVKDSGQERFTLEKVDEIFTEFEPALLSITTPVPGNVDEFIKLLQGKLDEQLESPPTNKIIEKPF